ncbi:MAG: aminopeptidase P family protein [Planctomycetales bacterium]|nr:aminopeptidase P family protein [bacterium]UNM07499.1 MAG: aminopeptidase P family protein [Planctomycetales bacterium]
MYTQRINALREKLGQLTLDQLLVTHPDNIFYLSGFTGSSAAILLSPGLPGRFITDFRYHERASANIAGLPLELTDSQLRPLQDVVSSLLPDGSRSRVGIEAGYMSFLGFSQLAATANIEPVPTVKLIETMRMRKDASEIALIREAVAMGEAVFSHAISVIGRETAERDIALEIEFQARRLGAEGMSFPPIVASGDHASRPHAGYTDRTLVAGAPLTIDMGVRLHNYCSDMTRTVFIGDCPQHWRAVYNTVREAKELAAASLRPGLRGCDVDKVARDFITEAGHGDKFGHGLGHGVGIAIHEDPRLLWTYEGVLESGNVVSNEPGIYLPGQGGVRIEDMMLLTDSGCENFNSLPTELQVIG